MKTIELKIQNHVARLQLNRPEQRNAFNSEVVTEIKSAFAEIDQRISKDDLRAVVISGTGKSFCAGADLQVMKDMAKYSLEENLQDAENLFEVFQNAYECKVPTLAMVHGHAMGGGLGLAACADLVFAEAKTQFCFSEVKLGILPAMISPFVFAKSAHNGVRRAMMTGEVFGASQAQAWGFVDLIGTESEIQTECDNVLTALLKAAPFAVQATKALIRSSQKLDLRNLKTELTRKIADKRVSPEGQEGLKAFFEKRDPSFARSLK